MRSLYADVLTGRRSRSPRDGFVLVMVLVLLTVSALSLAGLARRSLEAGEQAAAAQAELQRRWGILSCLRLYLPAAESLLEAEVNKVSAQGQAWPLPAAVSGEFILGNLRFSVLVADEEAKVNLNAVYRHGSDGANQVATVVEQSAGTDGPPPLIRPASADTAKRDVQPFRSWGQIFDFTEAGAAEAPADVACRLRDRTREITCWGSGRLNVRRASDQAIRLVCGDQLSPDVIAKLLSSRRESGIKGLDDLLSRMALRIEDRAVLERLLTDRSSRHSIWIVVRDERRAWVFLAFDRGRGGSSGTSGSAQETFTW